MLGLEQGLGSGSRVQRATVCCSTSLLSSAAQTQANEHKQTQTDFVRIAAEHASWRAGATASPALHK